MVRKFGLPLLALIGIAFGIFMIYYSSRQPPLPPILFAPPVSPYKHFIAGEGLIEAVYKNVPIFSAIAELITDVYVEQAQTVKKGTPLFKVDTRHLESQLLEAEAELKVALTDYENQKVQFSFYQKLKDKTAVSEQVYQATFYAMQLACTRVETVRAQINVIKTDIERSTTRAPFDGEVLQSNIRPGQFANSNPYNNTPPMLFGNTIGYHLRVDIDEEDAWRVIKGEPATAFVRGNSKISIPLEYAYFEPYIIPKVSLSGSDTERVDTRVLQLVFQFPRDKYPIYAGQLLDVYIKALPSGAMQ